MNIWKHFVRTMKDERGIIPAIIAAVAKGAAAVGKGIAMAGKVAMTAKTMGLGSKPKKITLESMRQLTPDRGFYKHKQAPGTKKDTSRWAKL